MTYFSEVLSALFEQKNDRTVYATREKWGCTKQVRYMNGIVYGEHLAIFDTTNVRAQPYVPTTREMTASDWKLAYGEDKEDLMKQIKEKKLQREGKITKEINEHEQ